MKYLLNFKSCLFAVLSVVGLSSCEDFLHRPDPAAYTTADFYKSDAQLLQAANILYNSPWHDFTRGYIGVGDTQSGNHYTSKTEGYHLLNHKSGGVQESLESMAASLWAVNARANTTLENFKLYSFDQPGVTEAGRNTAKGEVLVWKAMAYFYLVRIYGAVPIVHDNSKMLADMNFNEVYRANIEDVYTYIVLILEEAIRCLPETNQPGRIDKYSAYGLLAKVYLTKSGYGMDKTRNQADLDKAKEYAGKVVHESGRVLEPEYSDIFRATNRYTQDGLITWQWIEDDDWTCANPIQADLAMEGFTGHGDGWGAWSGPSIDLQDAFGEDATIITRRQNVDKRRKATMMMYGDVYDYFFTGTPKTEGLGGVKFPNGFDYTLFCKEVAKAFNSPTGAGVVKHLSGYSDDPGSGASQMRTSVPTHILRLADVYLVYAEAILGNSASTTDSEALYAFNAVRQRATGVANAKSSITFDDIFKERRLELAYEGDFWYDFVRLSYYDMDSAASPTYAGGALTRLNAQRRMAYRSLNGGEDAVEWGAYLWKGVEGLYPDTDPKYAGKMLPRPDEEEVTGQGTWLPSVFEVPFPETDVQMNPRLLEDPQPYSWALDGDGNPTIEFYF